MGLEGNIEGQYHCLPGPSPLGGPTILVGLTEVGELKGYWFL